MSDDYPMTYQPEVKTLDLTLGELFPTHDTVGCFLIERRSAGTRSSAAEPKSSPRQGVFAESVQRTNAAISGQKVYRTAVALRQDLKPTAGIEPATCRLQEGPSGGARMSARAPNLSPRLVFHHVHQMVKRGHLRSKSISICCNVTARMPRR